MWVEEAHNEVEGKMRSEKQRKRQTRFNGRDSGKGSRSDLLRSTWNRSAEEVLCQSWKKASRKGKQEKWEGRKAGAKTREAAEFSTTETVSVRSGRAMQGKQDETHDGLWDSCSQSAL